MLNGKKLVWILDDEWTDHSVERAIYAKHGFEAKATTTRYWHEKGGEE
ncbi:hypothetical protein [Cohnella sp. AR92]|nr:hypothetical protein [Cohnella sp. AR92]